MNRSLTKLAPVMFASILAFATGCGSGGIGTVTGTVHLDGKPLEGALVTFYPEITDDSAMDGGGASMGRTDAEGKYELIYNRDTKGAQVGEHKVYIETLQEGGGGDYGAGRKEEVPTRYNSETELKVTVKSGSNVIDFLDLTSEGEKNKGRQGGRY